VVLFDIATVALLAQCPFIEGTKTTEKNKNITIVCYFELDGWFWRDSNMRSMLHMIVTQFGNHMVMKSQCSIANEREGAYPKKISILLGHMQKNQFFEKYICQFQEIWSS